MQLSLGPVLYYWSRQRMLDFYRQVAESPAKVVYLGETVCLKRRELSRENYLIIAQQLREAGKQVVLSTLTLLESPADLRQLRRHCNNGDFWVEANDMGAVGLLSERRLPFVAGAALNIYNQGALCEMLRLGMKRWVMPVEMSREWLVELLEQPEVARERERFETEVFAFGHLPLAWSARCFTARSENRPKDDCRLCCINYPEGRPVHNREGVRLFTLNGIQTLSGERYNLINELPRMQPWVDTVRLSPQSEETFEWLKRFAVNCRGGQPQPLEEGDCNGYWHRLAGMDSA